MTTKEQLFLGAIFESGSGSYKKYWVVDRMTDKSVWFRILIWSDDLINEPGCMRKGTTVERVKISLPHLRKGQKWPMYFHAHTGDPKITILP